MQAPNHNVSLYFCIGNLFSVPGGTVSALAPGAITASTVTTITRMTGSNCRWGLVLLVVFRAMLNKTQSTDPSPVQAQKRLAELAARTGTGGVGEAVEFSSPLRVRVLKEVERVRREEEDLDTGRRRSWLETNEYEVLDLCGDTPPPPNQSR